MKKGDKVIYKKKLKGLPTDSVGIIKSVYEDWCVIIYPQYYGKNLVSSHSAKLIDINPQ